MKDFKYHLENLFGYAIIIFITILCHIYGFERIKKLGYCFIRKYEEKNCDNCEKTNIFRQKRSLG